MTTLAGNISGTMSSNGDNFGHADGVGTLASFNRPSDVAVDSGATFAIIVSVIGFRRSCSRSALAIIPVLPLRLKRRAVEVLRALFPPPPRRTRTTILFAASIWLVALLRLSRAASPTQATQTG